MGSFWGLFPVGGRKGGEEGGGVVLRFRSYMFLPREGVLDPNDCWGFATLVASFWKWLQDVSVFVGCEVRSWGHFSLLAPVVPDRCWQCATFDFGGGGE